MEQVTVALRRVYVLYCLPLPSIGVESAQQFAVQHSATATPVLQRQEVLKDHNGNREGYG